MLTVRSSRSSGECGDGSGMPTASGLEHAPVARERIENTGQPAGEGDDGDGLTAARGDAERPEPERLGLGRPAYAFDPKVAEAQVAKLNRIRRGRDHAAVKRPLGRLKDETRGTGNLMEPILETVKAYATLGEIEGAMKDVFGEHKEPVAL